MFFIHCDRCLQTIRAGTIEGAPQFEPDLDLEIFRSAHAGCTLRLLEPTGRSIVSGPRHEPMAERWFEVRDREGVAIAIGTRTSLDEPIQWRIERGALEEDLDVALDGELFWDMVERALQPHSLPQRPIAAWANRVDNFLRTMGSSDVVVLYDDTQKPDQSAACLTLTARTPLEASLRTFGFDAETEACLLALFNDSEFPPLRVTRRMRTRRPPATLRRRDVSLTHRTPSINPA